MDQLFNIHEYFLTAIYLDKVITAAARITGNTDVLGTYGTVEYFIKRSITATRDESYLFTGMLSDPVFNKYGRITGSLGFIDHAVSPFRKSSDCLFNSFNSASIPGSRVDNEYILHMLNLLFISDG